MPEPGRTRGLLLVSLVFAFGALLPVTHGRSLKATLLVLALIFFLVALRQMRGRSTPPPAL